MRQILLTLDTSVYLVIILYLILSLIICYITYKCKVAEIKFLRNELRIDREHFKKHCEDNNIRQPFPRGRNLREGIEGIRPDNWEK